MKVFTILLDINLLFVINFELLIVLYKSIEERNSKTQQSKLCI